MRGMHLVLIIALVGGVPAFAASYGDEEQQRGQRHGKFMHKRLEKMDVDGDGLVSETEFVEAHREQFAKMDGNGDGQLSQDELAEAP